MLKVAGVLTSADIIRAGGELQTGLGHGEGFCPCHSLPGNPTLESSFAETCLRELAGSEPESGMSSQGRPEGLPENSQQLWEERMYRLLTFFCCYQH